MIQSDLPPTGERTKSKDIEGRNKNNSRSSIIRVLNKVLQETNRQKGGRLCRRDRLYSARGQCMMDKILE